MNEAMAGIMSGGAATFKFEKKGDTVEGTVEALERRQDQDVVTKQPKIWPNGDPVWVYLITIHTELRDSNIDEDDGTRTIWCRNRMIAAVRDAFKAAGLTANDSPVGGKLKVQYYKDDVPKQKGHNGAKMYRAKFEPAAVKSEQWAEDERQPGDETENDDVEIPFD